MQTHLINLDRTPERLAAFHSINPHMRHVRRFSAVDGTTIDRAKLIEQNIFMPGVDYSPGAIGCALSHMRLWNIVISEGAPATLVEDDAIMHHDFNRLAPAAIAELPPDWDMVVWGWNMESAMVYELYPGITANLLQIGNTIRENAAAFQASNVKRNLHRLKICFGTICYSISPAGARKLCELILPIRYFEIPLPGLGRHLTNMGIDVVLTSLYSKINAYVAVPPLVLTVNDVSTSTVQN